MLMQVLPYPSRFRLAVTLGKLGKPFAGIIPKPMQAMLSLLPTKALPKAEPLPEVIPAQGTRRARVALLAGCVQQALDPAINLATIRVLSRNGVEVIIPKNQGCCGALANHVGQQTAARGFASRTMPAFPADVDPVLTNAAGGAENLKKSAPLLDPKQEAEKAREFSRRAQDVSHFLAALGLSSATPPLNRTVRVAYHDACHLGHAQNIRTQPRTLLSSIPGLQLVEVPEAEICCGSAGVYNITQPDMARDLQKRKVCNILSTGVEMVATGKLSCITQIQAGVTPPRKKTRGHQPPVFSPGGKP